jgi:hypothetical protein
MELKSLYKDEMVWSGRVPILVSTTILLAFRCPSDNIPCSQIGFADLLTHPKP